MSYSCCGWHCSVPVSSSSHQCPARKLKSQGVKEECNLLLLRLCIAFLQLFAFPVGLCVLLLAVSSREGREEPLLQWGSSRLCIGLRT